MMIKDFIIIKIIIIINYYNYIKMQKTQKSYINLNFFNKIVIIYYGIRN